MFGKFLISALLAASVITVHSTVSSLGADPAPQVKGSQTAAISFDADNGLPDPNKIFSLVNQARQAEGLSALVANQDLMAMAQVRARDMAANKYYAHKSPRGQFYYDLFEPQGVDADYSCENLDLAFTLEPQQYVKDWLSSAKGHRECLLNPDTTVAGYAAIKFVSAEPNTPQFDSYIVVAIHSSEILVR